MYIHTLAIETASVCVYIYIHIYMYLYIITAHDAPYTPTYTS